jgi:arylsulfatase
VPTILEAAGLPEPVIVNGVAQQPLQGTSMAYSFDAGAEPERHDLQYFEMLGNRGIYHQGWMACTLHRSPWESASMVTKPFADDVWELYAPDDWSQAHDLAAEMPDKLEEMKTLWMIEAAKHSVLPLDDRAFERFNADLAGRPQLIRGSSQVLYKGMTGLSENSVLNMKNKSFAVTSELEIPDGGAEGVLIAQGGAHAGWAIYFVDGVPHYCHNFVGLELYTIAGERPMTLGTHQLRIEFDYDGDGIGKGGTTTLFIDGDQVGQGRLEHTVGILFATDETVNVGRDSGTTVTDAYPSTDNDFTGEINWIQLDVDEAAEDVDHYMDPGERFRSVLGRH